MMEYQLATSLGLQCLHYSPILHTTGIRDPILAIIIHACSLGHGNVLVIDVVSTISELPEYKKFVNMELTRLLRLTWDEGGVVMTCGLPLKFGLALTLMVSSSSTGLLLCSFLTQLAKNTWM